MDWLKRPDRWRAMSAPARWIGFAGQHSLPIYLLHQPILIGLLAALTAWGPLAPKADRSAFLASCQRACVAQGRSEAECDTGCRCVADAIDHSGDADRLATVTPERRAAVKPLADACMGLGVRLAGASSAAYWSASWIFLAGGGSAAKSPIMSLGLF
jgi:hypothetical protein